MIAYNKQNFKYILFLKKIVSKLDGTRLLKLEWSGSENKADTFRIRRKFGYVRVSKSQSGNPTYEFLHLE